MNINEGRLQGRAGKEMAAIYFPPWGVRQNPRCKDGHIPIWVGGFGRQVCGFKKPTIFWAVDNTPLIPAFGGGGGRDRGISEFKASLVCRVPEQPELHRQTLFQKQK